MAFVGVDFKRKRYLVHIVEQPFCIPSESELQDLPRLRHFGVFWSWSKLTLSCRSARIRPCVEARLAAKVR